MDMTLSAAQGPEIDALALATGREMMVFPLTACAVSSVVQMMMSFSPHPHHARLAAVNDVTGKSLSLQLPLSRFWLLDLFDSCHYPINDTFHPMTSPAVP